jgi:hypothetical protein
MRTKLVIGSFTVFLATMFLLTFSAGAADISGKWIAQTSSPSGSSGERIFTLKVAGDKVTGTIMNQQTVNATFEEAGKPKMTGKLTTQSGNPVEISDGKITGNDISFVTVSKMGEMEMKTTYKGTISGNEIKFTAEMQMPAGMSPPGAPSSSPSSSGSSSSAQQGPKPQEMVAKKVNP